jgi:hypothetical protein
MNIRSFTRRDMLYSVAKPSTWPPIGRWCGFFSMPDTLIARASTSPPSCGGTPRGSPRFIFVNLAIRFRYCSAQGTLPLAEIAAVLKEENWTGWAMNEEQREDGSKQGLGVIGPAFNALDGAFPA